MDNNQLASEISRVFNNALQAKIAARVNQRVCDLVGPNIDRLEKALVGLSNLDITASTQVMVAREELRKSAGVKEGPGSTTEAGAVCQMKALNDILQALCVLIADSIRERVMKEEVNRVVNSTMPECCEDEASDLPQPAKMKRKALD